MSRAQILATSLVCCAFGLLSVWGPANHRSVASVVNIVLAVTLFFLAGRDLKARGWELGYLYAGTYLLPLIGLIVYFALRDRPIRQEGSAVR